MSYNPLNDNEIQDGAPVDEALFGKVKSNFENHEARLVNEELDVDLVRAYQIVIDDVAAQYVGGDIEAALAEVMAKVNTHQTANQTLHTSHVSRLTSVEDRATALEGHRSSHDTRITNAESNIVGLGNVNTTQNQRLTANEGNIVTNTASITSLTGRVTTAENNITANTNSAANATDQLSMSCFMVDKAKFLAKCIVNTGAFPTYNASSSNNTGTGAVVSTVAAQQITYNTMVVASALVGVGANVILLAPVGTSITFGLKCYDASQAFIQDVNLAAGVASTGSFQLIEGHAMNAATGSNLPSSTRYVKPFISWTGNTASVILDYMSCMPLGYSRYAILG